MGLNLEDRMTYRFVPREDGSVDATIFLDDLFELYSVNASNVTVAQLMVVLAEELRTAYRKHVEAMILFGTGVDGEGKRIECAETINYEF